MDAKTAVERESGSSTVMLCGKQCAACWDTHREEMAKGMVLDPVCGEVFDSSKGVRRIVDGRSVVFCCDKCSDVEPADKGPDAPIVILTGQIE